MLSFETVFASVDCLVADNAVSSKINDAFHANILQIHYV